jgi:hypothetical protein
MPAISATAGIFKSEDHSPGWPTSKITRAKRAGEVAQAIEHLFNK